jgi:hypothetical protein
MYISLIKTWVKVHNSYWGEDESVEYCPIKHYGMRLFTHNVHHFILFIGMWDAF